MSISVENYLRCCRICLGLEKSDYFLDIYSTTLPGTTTNVEEALRKTTGIECTWDNHLPSKICQSCQLRLQDAFNFIMECADNNSLLQSFKKKSIERFLQAHKTEPLAEEENASAEAEESLSEQPTPCEDNFPTVKEVLQIEVLETPNENYVILELGGGGGKAKDIKHKVEPESETTGDEMMAEETTCDEEAEEDGEAIGDESMTTVDDEEQAIDAVDFILRNLQPTSNDKRKKVSPVERRYQCEVCEKTFQRKSNLVDHLRFHANVKLFSCTYCSAAFVQAGNLKSHIRRHTLEKPYKCQYCEKSYSQSSALKTHIRSHTNERDYVCDICQKGFTNSSDLGKHKLTHSDLRFYQCVTCVKRYFTQKVHLKKHLVAFHHGSNINELLQQGTLKEGVRVVLESTSQEKKPSADGQRIVNLKPTSSENQ